MLTCSSQSIRAREIHCQRKQSAGHAAGPHVESDKTEATTPHPMDTRSLGRCGEWRRQPLADEGTRRDLQHRWWRRCPLRGWDEEGSIKKIVSIQRETTICQDALKKPNGMVQRFSPERMLCRTSSLRHTTAVSKSAIPSQNSMIRRGWRCEDLEWNVAARSIP